MSDGKFLLRHHEAMVNGACYGKLIVCYEAGQVTVVKKELTFKPDVPAHGRGNTNRKEVVQKARK